MEEQLKSIQTEILSLQSKLDQLNTAKNTQAEVIVKLKRQISNLTENGESSSLTSTILSFDNKSRKSSFIWKLDATSDWKSFLSNDKCGPCWMRSGPFCIEEQSYNMELRIRLQEDTLGVSLHLLRGNYDHHLKWPLRRALKLSLINVSKGLTLLSKIITPPPTEDVEKNLCWKKPQSNLNHPMFHDLSFYSLSKEEKYLNLELEFHSEDKTEVCDLLVPDYWSPLPNGLLINELNNGHYIIKLENIQMSSFIYPKRLTPLRNYFEVQILNMDTLNTNSSVGIGLSPPSFNFTPQMPGWNKETIGFHADDGALFLAKGKGTSWGPPSSTLDVLGCGIKFPDTRAHIAHDWGEMYNDATVDVFFTRNGIRVGETINVRYPDHCLYPAIGLVQANTEVEFVPPYLQRFDDLPVMDSQI